jgi:MoxR-like ATPase
MAGADSVEKLEDVIVRSAEQVAGQIRTAKEAISTVIFGQDRVIENTLVTILSGGHALLIGVPGLAKTKLVETLGITLGLDAKRIQFTPDLMPSDILGAEVLDESTTGKRCRNNTSRSRARATICRNRSMCWRRKIRWSRKAPTRCRKRSLIAS